MNLKLVLVCLAICVPTAFSFWRLPCAGPITHERIDPIVNPGHLSAHLHTVMGASGFHASSTPESIRKSKCSTCIVKEDMSNYWIASLFYQHKDGTFETVEQNGGMLVYYLQREGRKGEKIRAFPDGLRMVAGDPHKTQGDKSVKTRAISYACINYAQASKETHSFPQKDCPQGLRVQVFFPSCWNGKDLDSPDHFSHMAYPDGMDNGKCPSTHPVRLISIFYEVYYNVGKFRNDWLDRDGKPTRAMPYFWSTGDNTGFGHHGDFMNGWNTQVLQRAVDDCRDNSGVVEKCRHFTFRSNDEAKGCKPEYLPAVKEQVEGKFKQIPNVGKIPIAPFDPCGRSPFPDYDWTPKDKPLGNCRGRFTGRPAYTPVNGKLHHSETEGQKALPLAKAPEPIDQKGYLGCFKSTGNDRRRSAVEKRVDGGDKFTPETCRQAVKKLGGDWKIFSVQFGGECWASKSATSYRDFGTSDKCGMDCRGDASKRLVCGGPGANQVYRVNA